MRSAVTISFVSAPVRHSLTVGGPYSVFYDVAEAEVVVIAVLHKRETAEFYREEAR
jgi:plasmid stabilization system protein ParE